MRKFILLVVGAVTLGGFALGQVAYAQSQATLRPFGGTMGVWYPCTCTGGSVWYTIIGGAFTGTLTYTVKTQLYANRNLPYTTPGASVLGLYNPQATQACQMYAGYSCFTLPSRGMIMPITGNSLK